MGLSKFKLIKNNNGTVIVIQDGKEVANVGDIDVKYSPFDMHMVEVTMSFLTEDITITTEMEEGSIK